MISSIPILGRTVKITSLAEDVGIGSARFGTMQVDFTIVESGPHARVEVRIWYANSSLKRTFTDKPCLRAAITWAETAMKDMALEMVALAGLRAIELGMDLEEAPKTIGRMPGEPN